MNFSTINFKHENKSVVGQGTYDVDESYQRLPLLNSTTVNEYYNWGMKNTYPLWIANIAQLYPAEGILNGTIDMVHAFVPEIDKEIISDYVIFGNAFTTKNMEHIPAMSVRIASKGGIYSDTASYFSLTTSADNIKHIKEYNHLRFDNTPYLYSAPYWHSIIKDLLVIARSTNFAYNVFENELGASGILTINNSSGNTSDEQKRIKRETQDHFTGSNNGGKYLIGFADSNEEHIKFTRIDTDANLTRKYDTMSQTARENVYAGFRCYPQLFGIKLQDSFINDEDYNKMLTTYNRLVVTPIADKLCEFMGIQKPAEVTPEPAVEPTIEPKQQSVYDKIKRFVKSN
jgi:hypothetical protein